MRKLISFLVRYFTVILFLGLQALAFYLIYRSQPYQHSTLYALQAEWSGYILETYDNISNYFKLGQINHNLALENATLRSANKNAYFSIYSQKDTVRDTLYRQQYSYLEAQVVNSSHTKQNNYITLNKGKVHGVKPDMGVLSTNGIIGVVKDVSAHYCTVIPIIHSKSLLSVDFKRNPFFGTLSWDGKNYRMAQLSDIPREAKFTIGDTIVSSQRSLAFPPGIPVGIVEDYKQNPEDLSFLVSVRLAENFAALDYVYIIDNMMRLERETLEAQIIE